MLTIIKIHAPAGRDSTKSPPDPESDCQQVLPWFEMALSCDLMLRHLVNNLPRGEEGVRQTLVQLRDTLSMSTPTSRLVVICGLPTFYSRGLSLPHYLLWWFRGYLPTILDCWVIVVLQNMTWKPCFNTTKPCHFNQYLVSRTYYFQNPFLPPLSLNPYHSYLTHLFRIPSSLPLYFLGLFVSHHHWTVCPIRRIG